MADLPYVENDGYVGHWVVDEIYVPSPIGEPSTFENGKRLYVKPNHYTKQITKIKECSDEVAKYFDISSDINLLSQAQINKMSMKQMRQYVKDHNIEMPKEKRPSGDYYGIDYRSAITSHNKRRLSNYYRNGRRWYTAFNASKNNRTIQPQNVQAVALCEELSPFNNVTIDIASLVCSQLSIEREWSEIFQVLSECNPESDCYDCTEVGRKISSSLIKIAALRIFADPEQSILELPVNSIDSYFPESRVGKFGMGFFSFLYWLIGHPQRKLYLYSWFEKDGVHCAYKATISEGKFGLEMNLRILESDVTQTGTFIYMDSIGDPFDESEVSNFTQQLRKLKHIRSTIISTLLDSETNTAYLTESAKGNSPRIIVCIEREKIYVEDYASGIPINVLLGSLLVPSISTKTIADKIKIPKGWKPSSRIEYAGYQMIILVSGVAVVQLGKTLERGIIIEMPPTTRLPVSRDDIILDTETASIFAEEIQKVLEESVVYFATFLAQKGLKSYIDYTFGSQFILRRSGPLLLI